MAFPAYIDLTKLDGSNGFTIKSIANEFGDFLGQSVSGLGDINGDGIDDLAIGAYTDNPVGNGYVLFGQTAPFTAEVELSALESDRGFVLGDLSKENIGLSIVNAAGDVNGDGIEDLIVGTPQPTFLEPELLGKGYVVFGRDTNFAGIVELSALDGDNGFVIQGQDPDNNLGLAVSGAGDFNGDGFDDLIVGANGAPNGQFIGAAYVVFGQAAPSGASLDVSTLDGNNGFVLNGVATGDFDTPNTGSAVSTAGDINGDGLDDIIIGAPGADVGDNSGAGKSYVVFGQTTAPEASFDLADLDGSNGFTINGINESDFSGAAVSAAGDLNGDGLDDIIIGASFADPDGRIDAGQSYVIFGRTTPFEASFDLADLDGSNGFLINGIDANDGVGGSVSGTGDINGDGLDDVIIGTDFLSFDEAAVEEGYVVFGRTTPFEATLELADLDGSHGFVLGGLEIGQLSGLVVSGAGDVNADGVNDLIVAAPGAHPIEEFLTSGEGFVVFGHDTTVPTVISVEALTPDGTYTAGDTVEITVLFSEAVAVGGTPQLLLETGTTDHIATYVSGSSTDLLTFVYIVQDGDTSDDLDYLDPDALALNGGSIQDAAGNDALLTLPAPGTPNSLGANADIIINPVPPNTHETEICLSFNFAADVFIDLAAIAQDFVSPLADSFESGLLIHGQSYATGALDVTQILADKILDWAMEDLMVAAQLEGQCSISINI